MNRHRLPLEMMTIDYATREAARVMRDMGRARYSDGELSVLAREIRRLHTAGRTSMYREIAQRLDCLPRMDHES